MKGRRQGLTLQNDGLLDGSPAEPAFPGALSRIGAHAVLHHRKRHADALRLGARKLMQTKPFKFVAVALANNSRALPSCL